MFTEKDFEAVKKIILEDIPDVESVILFGSYARGNQQEDSDMDFMILTKSEIDRSDKLKLLSSLQWDIARKGYKADLIIKSHETYLDELDIPTLSRVVHREGKTI